MALHLPECLFVHSILEHLQIMIRIINNIIMYLILILTGSGSPFMVFGTGAHRKMSKRLRTTPPLCASLRPLLLLVSWLV